MPSKKVVLKEHDEELPPDRELPSGQLASSFSSSIGALSRFGGRDYQTSPDRVTMWRDSDFRGERVMEPPSTSAAAGAWQQQQQHGQRRKQLHTQPAAGGRTGPSNFTRLPDIRKPHSSPGSPKADQHANSSSPCSSPSRRVSLTGANGVPFVAGATVAGPNTAASLAAAGGHGGGRHQVTNTAAAAAAVFALAGGNQMAAANIAYNVNGGSISPPLPGDKSPARTGSTPLLVLPDPAAPVPPPQHSQSSNGAGAGGGLQQGRGPLSPVGGASGGDGAGEGEEGGYGASQDVDDVLKGNERLRSRLVSLPNIVCRSANGDVFLVDLGNVQAMLHKRELGEEGLNVLSRSTPRLAHAISSGSVSPDAARAGGRSPKRAGGRNAHRAGGRRRNLRHGASAAGDGAEDGGGSGGAQPSSRSLSPVLTRSNSIAQRARSASRLRSAGGNAAAMVAAAAANMLQSDPVLGEEVRQHLATTDAVVERRRRQLQADWRAGRATGVNPAVAAREMEEAKRAAAIDFAVNRFVPRRLALMALNMHLPAGTKEREELAGEQEGAVPVFGAAFKQAQQAAVAAVGGKGGGHWGKVQVGIDRLYDRMPFVSNWTEAIKKLKREEGIGWDDLLHGGEDLYVKGRNEHQGTNIYVLKCQELGVTPSTQVVQQLASADANMSHCKLGRQGAAALRHALSANVTITHLNLQDNQLDATAIEDILAGLYNGTMAKQPRARKLLERRSLGMVNSNALAALASAPSGGTRSGGGAGRIVLPQASRYVPGELSFRLIPTTLIREQEQRRAAAEEQQRQEEEARAAEASQAAAAAAAANGLTDAPEWLRIINDPTRLGVGEAQRASNPSLAGSSRALSGTAPGTARAPDLPARMPRPAAGPGASPVTRLTCAITSLDLSNNPLGINGVRALAELLDPTVTPYQFLKHLILNKCGIPEGGGRALASALAHGNSRLAVLALSSNSLGNGSAAMFGELLALPSGLEELDLSWNQIKAEGARSLAAGVAQNNKLTRLNMSWNGLESPGVVALGNMLGANDCLTWLDLTNTRMGAEACLMLAEGIKVNRTLEVLILNGNSVGDDGARFLMDALKVNTSLRYLGLQGTNMSAAARGNAGAASFNPLSPDGSYTLNLALGPDRAIASHLCELDAAAPADLMRNIRLGDRNIPSCKAQHWPESLPMSGLLSFDFVSKRVSKSITVMEAKKFSAMAAQFDDSAMSDKEKLSLVEVMAPFNYLTCAQAAALLRRFSIGDEQVLAAALLFSRAADLDDNITQLSEALGADASTDLLHRVLGWYSYVRFTNPTGHYELHLSSRVHAALATRLKDVAYSEPPDSSNWVNVIYDLYTSVVKVASNFGPPEDWKGLVPHAGTVSFDYVSAVCVPPDAAPVTEVLLNEVITQDLGIPLDASGVPQPERDPALASEQVARLRPIVANMAFTTAQVKRLVEAFEAPPHRVEVLVTCYCLIVDRPNMWTVLYALSPLEQALAMWRLGPDNLFDKAHPTGHYVLDLSHPAHEAVARKLVDLANANPELPNFWNIRLNGVPRAVSENRNMWGTFTAETASPFMEFDFIGQDGFEMLGRSKADVDALGPGDRLDLRTKQARRLELTRVRTMYAYYEDGSGWARPAWQSRQQLMRALADKAPWQAAWDRMARLLLRHDLRCSGMEGESPVEDVFFNATGGEDAMTVEQWQAVLKDWGFARLEIGYMVEAFEAAGRHATPKDGPAYKPLEAPHPPDTAATNATAAKPGTPGTPGTAGGGTPQSLSPAQLLPQAQPQQNLLRSSTQRSIARQGGSETPGALRGKSGADSPAPSIASSSQLLVEPPVLVPNTVIDFPVFAGLFLKEPPRSLRMYQPPAASAAAATATAAAATGSRARRAGRAR